MLSELGQTCFVGGLKLHASLHRERNMVEFNQSSMLLLWPRRTVSTVPQAVEGGKFEQDLFAYAAEWVSRLKVPPQKRRGAFPRSSRMTEIIPHIFETHQSWKRRSEESFQTVPTQFQYLVQRVLSS
jgi:hypothetical protein